MHVAKVGNWCFEIKQVRAIRANKFGEPYDATALITIVNGQVAIENLLAVDSFTRSDFNDIHTYLKQLGFKQADWRRFNKNGQSKKEKQ